VRLTLRTLLSYLDDTLEPAQAKTIGAKVAESEQARELMERIKQVTRRRRLTAPSTTGPGGIDANTIAEYLDNDVTPEQAAELEQICLASDVHLAEVAACHQILTLVLGEPALVPPSAKQRMYGLVKGPESIPFRKPAKATAKDDQDLSSELEPDQDETLRLGLPAVGGGNNRNLWLIAGGGVLAACLLVVAVWQLMSNVNFNRGGQQVAQNGDGDKEKEKERVKEREAEKEREREREKEREREREKAKSNTDNTPKTDLPIKVDPAPADTVREVKYEPATMQPMPVGHYVKPAFKDPTVLLEQAEKKKTEWLRINDETPIVGGRRLVSLSGSKSIVALNSGVELTLWGNLPQVTLDPTVAESRLILHANAQLDADLTLERGRIILRNKKADGKDALIRVRFDNPTTAKPTEEYFDITLNGADAAVVVERACRLDEPFFEKPEDVNRAGPTAFMTIFAYNASASIRFGQHSETVSKQQKPILQWISRQGILGAPQNAKAMTPPWIDGMPTLKSDDAKLARDKAVKAHETLAKLAEKKVIGVALAEMQESVQSAAAREMARDKVPSMDTFANWRHILTSRAAIDDVTHIYEDFQQEKTPIWIRGACLQVLRQWLTWNRENDYVLLEALRDYHGKQPVRVKIMELLHPISDRDAGDPARYQLLIDGLDNELLAIRTLSHAHLLQLIPAAAPQLVPQVAKIHYDPAMARTERAPALAQWRKLIPPGRLPGDVPLPK
jgi:hypothetical protein